MANDLRVTLDNLNCIKQFCMNCIKMQKQLIDIFATLKHELHGICDGGVDQWQEHATKKQFLRSSPRKPEDRSASKFIYKDIHYKGTVEKIWKKSSM